MPSNPATGSLAGSHRLLNDLRESIHGSEHDISLVLTLLLQAIETPGKFNKYFSLFRVYQIYRKLKFVFEISESEHNFFDSTIHYLTIR